MINTIITTIKKEIIAEFNNLKQELKQNKKYNSNQRVKKHFEHKRKREVIYQTLLIPDCMFSSKDEKWFPSTRKRKALKTNSYLQLLE